MKIEFNDNSKVRKEKASEDIAQFDMKRGSYKEMIDQREESLGEIKENIQKIFETWHGQPIAIVVVQEDENGMPTGTRTLVGGVGRPESTMRLSQGLDKASERAIQILAKGVSTLDSPKDMLEAIESVMEFFLGEKGK